jgi:hypothetical protein
MTDPNMPEQSEAPIPPRDNRLWLLFILIGAAMGISVGMMFFEDHRGHWGRVDIITGGTAMTLGAFVGWLVGIAVELVSRRSSRAASIARVLTAAILVGSISAPLGRLYANVTVRNVVEYQELAPFEMAAGAVLGTAFGLGLGLVAERRRRSVQKAD